MQLQSAKRSPGAIGRQNASEASLLDMFSSLWGMVRRQYRVIVISTLLLSAVGVVYVLVTPPSYTAKAQMISDSRRIQLSQSFGEAPIDPALAETQVEILKSEKVLLPVIKNLQLTENPEFNRSGLLSSFFGSRQPISEKVSTQRVLETLQNSLSVGRIGRTQLIEISCKLHDRELAARVVNAVVDSFIIDQLEAKAEGARRASAWLQERVRELGEQASGAERAVVEFKIANHIVDAGGRLMGEQQITELNSKLVLARGEVSEARAKLSRIETILVDAQRNVAVDATVADTLKSEVVTRLRDRYLELAARVADYQTRFGPNHLSVIRMRSQMQDIRSSIADELQRLAETYKSDLEIAQHKENETQKALEQAVANAQTTSQAQIKLRELESTAHSYRALHDSFLERHAEQVQQQSMRLSDARLISPAVPPLYPSHPKKLLALAIAAFSGALLGLGVAGLREMSDRVFRTGDQVEKALSKNCLALAPKLAIDATSDSSAEAASDGALKGDRGDSLSRRKGEASPSKAEEGTLSGAQEDDTTTSIKATEEAKTARKIISNKLGPVTAVVDAPFSRFAEAIQSIKLAADLTIPRRSSVVIGITSALPNEGKSTISLNLARLIARTGAPTALVDCDLRISGLTGILTPDADSGIREVIDGAVSFDETVWSDNLTEMMFLPSGKGSGRAHPADVLSSNSSQKLFERLRQEYEWVIVDLPPIGLVIDAQSTAHLLDSYVLVVEWGKTKVTTVKRALDSARDVESRLLGVVLNKVDIDQLQNFDMNFLSYGDEYYQGPA